MQSEHSEAIVIRPAVPADAKGLIAGLVRCYGNSYPNPLMYQENALAEIIRAGKMHSMIALNAESEVIGHCALSYDHSHDAIPEAGKLFVDPRYRGHHISDSLASKRLQNAIDVGLAGFWSACVTNHPYSQHEIISTGGVETGLLINGQPNTVHMDGLENTEDTRHTLIPFFVGLNARENLPIFLPKYHHALLNDVALRAKIGRIVSDHAPLTIAASRLSIHPSAEGKPVLIKVMEIGSDLLEELSLIMAGFASENHPVIYVDLSLTSPLATRAINDLESLGFFWGAWLPHFTNAGDVLRLQCLQDKRVSQNTIMCARPEGELIRDYVLSEYNRIQ